MVKNKKIEQVIVCQCDRLLMVRESGGGKRIKTIAQLKPSWKELAQSSLTNKLTYLHDISTYNVYVFDLPT